MSRRILFIIILFFAAFLAAGDFWLAKSNKKQGILLQGQSQQLAGLRRELSLAREFEQNYGPTDLARVSDFFVDREAPIEFIAFVERTAQELQLELTIAALPRTKEADSSRPGLAFGLQTKGRFESLLKLIKLLENAPYLLEIQDLSLTKGRELSAAEPKEVEGLNLALTLQVYAKN